MKSRRQERPMENEEKQQGKLAVQELWLPRLDVWTLEVTEFSL